jgi:hypothetical protein
MTADREGTVLGSSAAPGVSAPSALAGRVRALPDRIVEMNNASEGVAESARSTPSAVAAQGLYVVTSVPREAITAPAWSYAQLAWLF